MDPSKFNWQGDKLVVEITYDDDGTPTSIQSGQFNQDCSSAQEMQEALTTLSQQAGEYRQEHGS